MYIVHIMVQSQTLPASLPRSQHEGENGGGSRPQAVTSNCDVVSLVLWLCESVGHEIIPNTVVSDTVQRLVDISTKIWNKPPGYCDLRDV